MEGKAEHPQIDECDGSDRKGERRDMDARGNDHSLLFSGLVAGS